MKYYFIAYWFTRRHPQAGEHSMSRTMMNEVITLDPINWQVQNAVVQDCGAREERVLVSWQEITKAQYECYQKYDPF